MKFLILLSILNFSSVISFAQTNDPVVKHITIRAQGDSEAKVEDNINNNESKYDYSGEVKVENYNLENNIDKKIDLGKEYYLIQDIGHCVPEANLDRTNISGLKILPLGDNGDVVKNIPISVIIRSYFVGKGDLFEGSRYFFEYTNTVKNLEEIIIINIYTEQGNLEEYDKTINSAKAYLDKINKIRKRHHRAPARLRIIEFKS